MLLRYGKSFEATQLHLVSHHFGEKKENVSNANVSLM